MCREWWKSNEEIKDKFSFLMKLRIFKHKKIPYNIRMMELKKSSLSSGMNNMGFVFLFSLFRRMFWCFDEIIGKTSAFGGREE